MNGDGITFTILPITDASVCIKVALRQLLLERMLRNLHLIDLNPKPRPVTRTHKTALALDRKALADDVAAPRDIGVDELSQMIYDGAANPNSRLAAVLTGPCGLWGASETR